MIRLADESDLPELIRMSKNFYNVSGYAKLADFDEETITTLMLALIDKGTLLTDGKSGMLGFVVFPMLFNSDKLMAQELFWWVDKEARGNGIAKRLLNQTENIAQEMGAKTLAMLSISDLDGDKVESMYKKSGYKITENIYTRCL